MSITRLFQNKEPFKLCAFKTDFLNTEEPAHLRLSRCSRSKYLFNSQTIIPNDKKLVNNNIFVSSRKIKVSSKKIEQLKDTYLNVKGEADEQNKYLRKLNKLMNKFEKIKYKNDMQNLETLVLTKLNERTFIDFHMIRAKVIELVDTAEINSIQLQKLQEINYLTLKSISTTDMRISENHSDLLSKVNKTTDQVKHQKSLSKPLIEDISIKNKRIIHHVSQTTNEASLAKQSVY